MLHISVVNACHIPVTCERRSLDNMATTSDTVHWRGVNRLALITTDMDATVRFWHGVLDARLVVTLATPAFKHYFFEIAPGNTVAFFEYIGQKIETFAKPAGVPYEHAAQL